MSLSLAPLASPLPQDHEIFYINILPLSYALLFQSFFLSYLYINLRYIFIINFLSFQVFIHLTKLLFFKFPHDFDRFFFLCNLVTLDRKEKYS